MRPVSYTHLFDAENGAVTSFVIGTGRYMIKEHVQDQYAIFERNDNYYGEYMPYIKTVRVKCIPDADARYAAIKSGEVMALIDNGAILTAQVEELLSSDDRFDVVMTKSQMCIRDSPCSHGKASLPLHNSFRLSFCSLPCALQKLSLIHICHPRDMGLGNPEAGR